jgi:hypothetical protein
MRERFVLAGIAMVACDGGIPPSQPLSAECDPDHGQDACGAGLFCAALDGREVPTCYPVGSRLPGEECTASEQCANDLCVDGQCLKGIVGELCTLHEDCIEGLLCVANKCYKPMQ